MARKGDKGNPHLLTPDDWHENGVGYGDYCKCEACGLVARSTFTFDYFSDGPNLPMQCQSCKLGSPRGMHKVTDNIVGGFLAEDN